MVAVILAIPLTNGSIGHPHNVDIVANGTNTRGQTPLYLALAHRHPGVVTLLLQGKADPNQVVCLVGELVCICVVMVMVMVMGMGMGMVIVREVHAILKY